MPLGSRPVPVAGGGRDQQRIGDARHPGADRAAGKYFIVAAADGDGVIAEALENNNTKARRITVTAP